MNSNRFTKATVWDNIYDFDNRYLLREFRTIYDKTDDSKSMKIYEYIIWEKGKNIKRMRKSNYYYIDGTFHHPKEFNQLLIVMYKDIITNIKIPGIYILLNAKNEILYDYVFHSLLNIITSNRKYDIDIKSIVTDSELALINIIKKIFPKQSKNCMFFPL